MSTSRDARLADFERLPRRPMSTVPIPREEEHAVVCARILQQQLAAEHGRLASPEIVAVPPEDAAASPDAR